MSSEYNDDILPENYEKIAKAYASRLRDKGFVFVNLAQEEVSFLADEILVIIAKMQACLNALNQVCDSSSLSKKLENAEQQILGVYKNKKPHKFNCVENANSAFLSLISLQNSLIIKLLFLAIKSDIFEKCLCIITSICEEFSKTLPTSCFSI